MQILLRTGALPLDGHGSFCGYVAMLQLFVAMLPCYSYLWLCYHVTVICGYVAMLQLIVAMLPCYSYLWLCCHVTVMRYNIQTVLFYSYW
jgi:hypothetical protein